MPPNTIIYDAIYQIIDRIPKGRVATYGQVAALSGLFRGARRVGYALRIVPSERKLPWHRVVNAQGQISKRWEMGCEELQRDLLESEGVEFNEGNKISLEHYQWIPTIK